MDIKQLDLAMRDCNNVASQVRDILNTNKAAFESLAACYTPISVATYNATLQRVGMESAVISMEFNEDIRAGISMAGIGVTAQKIIDAIIALFNRLLGKDVDFGTYERQSMEEYKQILDVAHKRHFRSALPKFKEPQDEENFTTQWESYKHTLSRFDPQWANKSIKDLYLTWQPAQGRELDLLLGATVADEYSIPKCYMNNERTASIHNFNAMLDNIIAALDKLKNFDMDADGTISYDKENVTTVVQNLEGVYKQKWGRVRIKRGATMPKADWIKQYNGETGALSEQIRNKVKRIADIYKHMHAASLMKDKLKYFIRNNPDKAEHARAGYNAWVHDLDVLGRTTANIYYAIVRTDRGYNATVKNYRRLCDILIAR